MAIPGMKQPRRGCMGQVEGGGCLSIEEDGERLGCKGGVTSSMVVGM